MSLRTSIVHHLILLVAIGLVGGYVCYRTCIDAHLNAIQRLQARLQMLAQQKMQKHGMKKQAEKKLSRKSSAALVGIVQSEIAQQHAQLLFIRRFLSDRIECQILTTPRGALHILNLMREADCDYLSIKRQTTTDFMELRFKCES